MTKQTNKSEHYYTQSPTSDYKTYNITYNINTHSISLKTADGVFCKHSVDYGSNLLIETIAKEDRPGTLLDIGCGYGVVGISLAAIFDCKVTMCDINERAVSLAKENAKHVNAKVFQSDGFQKVEGAFDVIVTNPPIRAGKSVYYQWFDKSIKHLNDNGRFYCVIQKKQGAPSTMRHLESIYGNCEIIAKDKGYYIIKCTKCGTA